MGTAWVPVFCPECGAEDDADAAQLAKGYNLRCAWCDAVMLTTPPDDESVEWVDFKDKRRKKHGDF